MLMFRFWSSDPRGSDRTVQVDQPMLDFAKAPQPWISPVNTINNATPKAPKRPRQVNAAIAPPQSTAARALKRPRINDDDNADHQDIKRIKQAASSPVKDSDVAPLPPAQLQQTDIDRATDAIEQQFSLEILLKHDELRLINQELAKCQIALEQLRRCHLIPYPVNVPTPEQMLNISNGTGPALQQNRGDKMPQWAPPFGVIDGPYARHYAKWLIPDPKFDGIIPEMPAQADMLRSRVSLDGRSTRNSFTEFSASQGKGRPVRGTAGQRLQSLANGCPPPKDKNGPCVLKRSDGQTVKLVCIDCHRENFSSTQGFINHCRIAHKRDFKSHEEAAVHCGHPYQVAEVVGVVSEEKPVAPITTPSGLVHPFTRKDAMSESEACFSVVRRIQELLHHYGQGQSAAASINSASGTASNLKAPTPPQEQFSPAMDSPHLSRLLKSRGFNSNLGALVSDAKTKVDLDEFLSPDDEESDDAVTLGPRDVPTIVDSAKASAPVRMRVPARATMSPAVSVSRSTGSKCAPPPLAPYVTPVPTPTPQVALGPEQEMTLDEDILDAANLSPNTAVSNNAPSLVSDDGEYDDSVADSESENEDESIGARSISDVDEIDMDDEHRGLRHHRSPSGAGAGTTMRLGKDDSKHVTFVSPVKNRSHGKQKRSRVIGPDQPCPKPEP
ncbi:hypothetical protein F5Y15DRAFT_202905 [Xylariaceae sp. FL0016]|nr:hypothetical protein F5Y15DRAFT_202905 [Xylariaceae sp. FL0016]